jgi:hypothetical protein
MIEYYKNLSLESLFYINNKGLVCLEKWKDVVGFEGLYQVSNLGRIKSYDKRHISIDKIGRNRDKFYPKRIMRQSVEKQGYLRLSLTDRNKTETRHAVHRLVAIAFIPNPKNLPEVDHKKGNKKDNRVTELKWVTSKENVENAWALGLCKKQLGEEHSQSKLTAKDVLFIRASELSRKELAIKFSVGRKCIDKIINRKRWTHI